VVNIRSKKNVLTPDKIEFLERLPLWSWNIKEDEWNDSYMALLKYVNTYKSLPDKNYTNESGMNLGRWVYRQRNNFANKIFNKDHQEKLESIPIWVWDIKEANWNNSYHILQEFVKKNSRMPFDKEKSKGISLSSWIYLQKKNRDKLTSNQIRLLSKIPSWQWFGEQENSSFLKGIEELRKYVAKYNHAKVPGKFISENGFKLGSWVQSQRNRKKRKTISGDEKKSLEGFVGWKW
jgi:hypothetical protein